MDLSKISEILTSQKENEPFLALKIESDQIKSAFWTPEGGEAKILALGTTEEWGGAKEELFVACDASISAATAKLPEFVKETPCRLILGVPNSWSQDSKILDERLNELHFVANKLSLHPLGFVVNSEAISFYLKKNEEETVSAFLVYLGRTEITISLIAEGKVMQSETVGRSDNFALDVEEGILRFSSGANLPPRILLYNSEDLESARQTLISYPWQPPEHGRPGFLHLPRVEILPKDFDIEAIAFAGGEEIKKSIPLNEEKTEKEEEEEKKERVLTGEVEFIKGEDILVSREAFKREEEKPTEKVEEEPGFPPVSPPKKAFPVRRQILFNFLKQAGQFAKRFFQSFVKYIFTRLSVYFSSAKWLFLGIPSLIILVFLGFYYLSKAQVFLTVSAEQITKEFEFQIDPTLGALNLEGKIIPSREFSVEVSGTKTSSVTGKKEVGEKSKGEVIIYNRTDQPKTFSSGVILMGPGKLKFTLDQDLKVASKTPDLVSGVDRWGEAKAKVTSEEIGAQYNMAAGSQFYFESAPLSSFLAKNETAFSGGTSRQVSVVARGDQEKLFSDLEEELRKKAKQELEKKISPEEGLVWETLRVEIMSKKFDREIQEESSSLNLNLTTKENVLSFKKADLIDLALTEAALEIATRSGKKVEKDKSEVSFSFGEKKTPEDKFFLKAKAKIVLKQTPESDKVVKMVRGKSVSTAQKILYDLEGVKKIEIKIYPGIFSFFSRFPFKEKNIFIVSQIE